MHAEINVVVSTPNVRTARVGRRRLRVIEMWWLIGLGFLGAMGIIAVTVRLSSGSEIHGEMELNGRKAVRVKGRNNGQVCTTCSGDCGQCG